MVKVYTKNKCGKCTLTKKWLKSKDVEFTEVNIDSDEEALQEVLDMGFKSLPVVVIPEQEPFSGFKPDKLKGAL